MYHNALEIKDTKEAPVFFIFVLYREIDCEGRLRTNHFYKIDEFSFSFKNFPFMCSNIPSIIQLGMLHT
jgi:hypothetical protein